MKTCPRCKETKEDTAFYRIPTTGKLATYCIPCRAEWGREWRRIHKAEDAAWHQDWQKANPDKTKAASYRWREKHPEAWAANQKRWVTKNRLKYESERRAKVRKSVYEAYGGFRCSCCGETEPLFLTIDHIDNDGAEHRRNLKTKIGKGGTAFFDWLKRNKFPPGFQVLCRNCNWGKHANGGICPHRDPEGSSTRAAARKTEATAV